MTTLFPGGTCTVEGNPDWEYMGFIGVMVPQAASVESAIMTVEAAAVRSIIFISCNGDRDWPARYGPAICFNTVAAGGQPGAGVLQGYT
jgi:hypothetical protein